MSQRGTEGLGLCTDRGRALYSLRAKGELEVRLVPRNTAYDWLGFRAVPEPGNWGGRDWGIKCPLEVSL